MPSVTPCQHLSSIPVLLHPFLNVLSPSLHLPTVPFPSACTLLLLFILQPPFLHRCIPELCNEEPKCGDISQTLPIRTDSGQDRCLGWTHQPHMFVCESKKKKKEERRVKLLSECNLNLRLPACARSCPAQHRSFTTHQRKDGGVRQKQTDVSLLFFLSIFQK